jgi:hypothetical protein
MGDGRILAFQIRENLVLACISPAQLLPLMVVYSERKNKMGEAHPSD